MATVADLLETNPDLHDDLRKVPFVRASDPIEPMPGGSHFHTYKLTGERGACLIKHKHLEGKPRKPEHLANSLIMGETRLSPTVLYHDEALIICEFIPGQRPVVDHRMLRHMASVIRELRGASPLQGRTDVVGQTRRLKKKYPIPDHLDRWVDMAIDEVEGRDTVVPSHNDLILGNLIQNEHGIFVIDWEISSMNVPEWDVAFFATRARLSPDQEDYFLSCVYDAVTRDIRFFHRMYRILYLGKLIARSHRRAQPDLVVS